MRTIDAESLDVLREASDDLLLVDVLSPTSYRREHVPGAVNIPLNSSDFVLRVQERAGSKDRLIVVYCASADCDASERAAAALERAGFTNVRDFEGGLEEWADVGKSVGVAGPVSSTRP